MRGESKARPDFLTVVNLNARAPTGHPLHAFKHAVDAPRTRCPDSRADANTSPVSQRQADSLLTQPGPERARRADLHIGTAGDLRSTRAVHGGEPRHLRRRAEGEPVSLATGGQEIVERYLFSMNLCVPLGRFRPGLNHRDLSTLEGATHRCRMPDYRICPACPVSECRSIVRQRLVGVLKFSRNRP